VTPRADQECPDGLHSVQARRHRNHAPPGGAPDYLATQALVGSAPGLDCKDLADQLRHADDRHVPQKVGIDLEETLHDPVTGGDGLAPGHPGMLGVEPNGQPRGDLPDHLDQMYQDDLGVLVSLELRPTPAGRHWD
jgi:hypothetical protein